MKKLFILLLSSVCVISSYAQLVVDETGRVAIGDNLMSSDDEPLPLLSDFSINASGAANTCAYINNTDNPYGLKVYTPSSGIFPSLLSNGQNDRSMPNRYGIYSQVIPNLSYYYYALYGSSYNEFATHSGHNYGVYGIAGNGSSGCNYGVFGTLYGTITGAGVYGSSFVGDTGVNVNGYYAGFFRGNTCTLGATTSASYMSPSDYRLNDNIEAINGGSLDNLLRMNVVKYDYKQREVETDSGMVGLYDEKSPILTHKHYGLIAQELQKIYPDLVVEDEEGYLSVNYVEIVPLLIHSIQELSAKLDEANKSIVLRGEGGTGIETQDALQTELFQNTPNPFTEKTTIHCTIAETVSQAMLYVYDMNGKQIAEYPVVERGDAQVVIEGNSLDAGMYMYSLIADGNVIDTKRMILTK